MSVRWRTNVADARNRWPICKSMSTEQTEAFLKLLEAYEGEGESDLSDQGRQIERGGRAADQGGWQTARIAGTQREGKDDRQSREDAEREKTQQGAR